MWTRRQFIAGGTAAAAVGSFTTPAGADSILEMARVICGFPPGGTTDAVSRQVAERLRGPYAKATLVDNRAGAAGRLAVEELKRNAPDGSVMLLSPSTVFTLYPHTFKHVTYAADDVTPVCSAVSLDIALGVGPLVPASVKTLKDFLAWAKSNPSAASFGTPGAGSPTHLLGALLGKESGVDLNHVPYRGSAPGMQDVLGGQIAAMSTPLGDFLPHLKTGKVRVLATSSAIRSRFTPDAATYKEQGFPSLVVTQWYGFFLPQKTPGAVVDRLAAGIKAGLAAPDVAQSLGQLGLEVAVNSPAEALKVIKAESAMWSTIVKKVGFKPEE